MAYGVMIEALAPPMRRAIFEKLKSGPLSVGEIAHGMPISRPAVSQHLRVLREARLVSERTQGRKHIYSIDGNGLGELRDYFDSFWTDALQRFKETLEASDAGEDDK